MKNHFLSAPLRSKLALCQLGRRTVPKVLIVGHSHVACIAQAIPERMKEKVSVLNLRKYPQAVGLSDADLAEFVAEHAPWEDPDILCLCMRGNLHNMVGMFEHSVPFAVGARDSGATPISLEGRRFIPRVVMKRYFEGSMGIALYNQLYSRFPNSQRLCLNAPPPVAERDLTGKDQTGFEDFIERGVAPASLRLNLFSLQSQIIRKTAAQNKARFLDLGQDIRNSDGFLSAQYQSSDFVHANRRYGEAALVRIIANLGERN